MATGSTLQYVSRKKLVYGKSGSRSKYNSTDVDAFFSADESAPPKSKIDRLPGVKAAYPVQKTEAKPHALKRPRAKRQDTFDVPSSEDDICSPAKRVSPPIFHPKPLIDDRAAYEALLSWEKERKRNKEGATRLQHNQKQSTTETRVATVSPEAQLRNDLARAAASQDSSANVKSPPKISSSTQQDGIVTGTPSKVVDLSQSSAAARLAARRRIADNSAPSSGGESSRAGVRANPKRPVLPPDDREGTPRKRARTSTESAGGDGDVPMTDVFNVPNYEKSPPAERNDESPERDLYDFPDSSADESAKPKSTMRSPKVAKKPTRRGKPTTYARSAPRKGISAPARLAEMVPTDTDTTEPPTRSSSVSTSRKSTPQHPSTPPSGRSGSPQTTIRTSSTMTPKQAQLWNRLLPNERLAPSPSALPIKELSISGKRRTAAPVPSVARKLTLNKSQPDVLRRRTRLVDRLKASATSSDGESSDEDEGDSNLEDENQPVSSVIEEGPEAKKGPSQASQSQSQTAPTTNSGPKITYSRMRSYLPEDTFEDDLMAGLTNDTPQAPKVQVNKSSQNSQKSVFDLGDSDDEESGLGRIRTIHELRASGRNIRGMEDIEYLLDDVKNHNISNRSRRRSALTELATKLAEKSFAQRFVGQSYEVQIAVECNSPGDDVADFIFAAAISLIMSSEPPEHAVRSLHEQDIIKWLARLLERDTEVNKLAKDRRSNMSKAAQSSLLDFANMLKAHPSLWEDNKPAIMTPRFLALKALDQLISKLRQLGDKSELLGAKSLSLLLRDSSEHLASGMEIETALTISILESLSTSSVSLSWPAAMLEQIGSVLPQPKTTSKLLQHTRFLTLRLCHNLTTDNVRNCRMLATASTVQHLLEAVRDGFFNLDLAADEEERKVALDLLVLAIGIMMNLAEHCDEARVHARSDADLLASLIGILQQGQKHMLEAESVEDTITLVPFGWLAVMHANLCQSRETKEFIASNLLGKNLNVLVEAVEEFLGHHLRADTFEGETGTEVESAFTEKLKVVLERLKEAEASV